MRLLTLTAILAGSSTLSAVMAVAQAARDTAIQTVISDQIAAFRAEDLDRAFQFASPAIRQLFGAPGPFGAMVRQGYPMVWRPAQVDYLGLRDEAGRVIQRVLIRDGAGDLHVLEYEMVETPEGWQINGVWLLPARGIS